MKRGTPTHSEIAAREGYQRPAAGGFLRRMRLPPRARGDAWRARRARPEILGVQAVTGDTEAREIGDEPAHERGRAADVNVRVARDAQRVEHVRADAPGGVVVDGR